MAAAHNYQLLHLQRQRFAQNCAHFAQYCFCDKCGLGNVETMAIIASAPAALPVQCTRAPPVQCTLYTALYTVQGLTRDQTSAISSSED